MISAKLASLLLNEALKTGGDFAELFIEKVKPESIIYDNFQIEGISNSSSFGMGVRILKNNQSLYGHTNAMNKKDLLDLVRKLAEGFNGTQIKTVNKFKTKKIKVISPIIEPYFEKPIEEKIKLLDLVSHEMKNYSPKIVRVVSKIIASRTSVEIYNSNGLHVIDNKERTIVVMSAVAKEGDIRETGYNSIGFVGGLSKFKNVDFVTIAKDVAKEAVDTLTAKECPSGKMPVVIGNNFGGVLFHEACGHALEASSVALNLSIFAGKEGQQIASPIVTAYDDGTIPYKWGSENVDDEGNPTQKTCLIKNGVLQNYLIDNFNGRRMNKLGNGACRRESYQNEPTSRMSNTYIDNGSSTFDEIIKNTKLGLYAKHLGGGSVDPTTGQFEFACSVAFIIRDGKICEQVKGATLIGTCEEILKNIDMVGNDLAFDCGYCGASSGSIPVSTGQPTIRIKEITVGGNGGKLE